MVSELPVHLGRRDDTETGQALIELAAYQASEKLVRSHAAGRVILASAPDTRTPSAPGLLFTSSLALVAVECPVLSSRARAYRRDHHVPRVSLPDLGVTSVRETCTVSSEAITPRSSLVQTHSPIPAGSLLLRLCRVFAGCYQPLLPAGSSRYLCESFAELSAAHTPNLPSSL